MRWLTKNKSNSDKEKFIREGTVKLLCCIEY
jgi:hypothetical protein